MTFMRKIGAMEMYVGARQSNNVPKVKEPCDIDNSLLIRPSSTYCIYIVHWPTAPVPNSPSFPDEPAAPPSLSHHSSLAVKKGKATKSKSHPSNLADTAVPQPHTPKRLLPSTILPVAYATYKGIDYHFKTSPQGPGSFLFDISPPPSALFSFCLFFSFFLLRLSLSSASLSVPLPPLP